MQGGELDKQARDLLDRYKLSSIREAVQIMLSEKKAREYFQRGDLVRISKLFTEDSREAERLTQLFAEKHSFEKHLTKLQRSQGYSLSLRQVLFIKLKSSSIECNRTRLSIWMEVSNAKLLKSMNPGLYARLAEQSDFNPFERQIRLDVERTVSRSNREMQDMLRRVLTAFSRRNLYIGYCQGLNFIALSLLGCGLSEEDSFWLLNCLVEFVLPLDYFTNMIGVVCDQSLLEECVRIMMPKLAKKFEELGVGPSLLTIQWFVCLFSSNLPLDYLLPLWDRLFLFGSLTLLKASLVFLGLMEDTILQVKDFAQLIAQTERRLSCIEKELSVQKFIQAVDSIYVSHRGIRLARQLVRHTLSLDQNGRTRKQDCNGDTVHCMQAIEEIKVRKRETLCWSFRQSRPPDIIQRYWDKSSYFNHQSDNSSSRYSIISLSEAQLQKELDNRLVLARSHHICAKGEGRAGKPLQTQMVEMKSDSAQQRAEQPDQSGAMKFFERFAAENDRAMLALSRMSTLFYQKKTTSVF